MANDLMMMGCGKSGASAFDPLSISNFALWLKADALSLNNNDPVTDWTDSSGAGNNFTYNNAPTFKTNIQNGKPGVLFDGVNDSMSANNSIFDLTSKYTLFVVSQTSTVGDQDIISTVATSVGDLLRYRNNGGTLEIRSYNPFNDAACGSTGQTKCFTLIQSATSLLVDTSKLRINGILANTSASGLRSLTHDGNCTIGAASDTSSRRLSGYIFEILLYKKELNSTEYGNVESYLVSRWGL